jgi:hypothetical protein
MPSRAPRRAPARRLLIIASAAIALSACAGPLASPTPVPAASDSKSETRSVGPFTSVSVEGPLNVVLSTSSSASVQVDAPSNIVPLVRTDSSGTELAVSVAAPGFASAKPVTVRIATPKLASVSLTGGATGELEAMGQALSVSVAGGATLKAIGTVQTLTLTVLGNSVAQLGDLTADTAAISAAGGAQATLTVIKQLTGTADSGSVITLLAKPTAQSVTVTGGAKLVGP